eukprot:TRINITY_DN7897_c0_g1_i14.p1 TRINITY_DN7897_c0_g1~~TRINITY_DN7897_c0_g1_i14.p1  ORF type:complete len:262 (+),score=48.56 TRINITY_DN7897_c0_g1_i14:184-969(+)
MCIRDSCVDTTAYQRRVRGRVLTWMSIALAGRSRENSGCPARSPVKPNTGACFRFHDFRLNETMSFQTVGTIGVRDEPCGVAVRRISCLVPGLAGTVRTGMRLVSVNGEEVLLSTYDQVIRTVRKASCPLELLFAYEHELVYSRYDDSDSDEYPSPSRWFSPTKKCIPDGEDLDLPKKGLYEVFGGTPHHPLATPGSPNSPHSPSSTRHTRHVLKRKDSVLKLPGCDRHRHQCFRRFLFMVDESCAVNACLLYTSPSPRDS